MAESGKNPYEYQPEKLHDENKYIGIDPKFRFKRHLITKRKKRYITAVLREDIKKDDPK